MDNKPISEVKLLDCMDGMKQFPDKFFDLAVVDPPYGIGRDGQIRCLANQLCEGSKEVLEAIYEQRKADNKAAGIKTEWDIRKCFEELRFNENHLGLGDIRLTIGMQEEICELVERFYIRR